MAFTALENKSIVSNKKDYDLNEQLRQTIIGFLAQLTDKQIDYQLKLDGKLLYYGNPELIKEIWINLLNNAVKFVDEKGQILIASKRLDNNQVEVTIVSPILELVKGQIKIETTNEWTYFKVILNNEI